MTRTCAECAIPIYKYNRSGLCKACCNRSPAVLAGVARAAAARVARFANWSVADRLAKFRVINGPDECWGWTGCDNGVGYPVLRVNKVMRVATQLALEEDGRAKPGPDYVACHSCDNPPCTNPAHLWWGTELENMRDAAAKGRLPGNRQLRKGKMQ